MFVLPVVKVLPSVEQVFVSFPKMTRALPFDLLNDVVSELIERSLAFPTILKAC